MSGMVEPTFGHPLPTRRATRLFARAVAACLVEGDLVVLSGPLGSGKTFLVRAICHALGLARRMRVTSPTFALVHEIPTNPRISHADLYRLDHARAVEELALYEYRDSGWVVIAEWGEPWIAEMGGDALLIRLSIDPRQASIGATGSRAKILCQDLKDRLFSG